MKSVDYIINGGGIKEIVLAKQLRDQGFSVLLIIKETCVAWEIHKTFQYKMTAADYALLINAFQLDSLPHEVTSDKEILLCPYGITRAVEAYCLSHNITFLYNTQVVFCNKEGQTICICGKFGVDYVAYYKQYIILSKKYGAHCSFAVMLESKIDSKYFLMSVTIEHDAVYSDLEFRVMCIEKALVRYRKEFQQDWHLGRFAEVSCGNNFSLEEALGNTSPTSYSSVSDKKPHTLEDYDVVVVGGGTAGTMAAIYSARAGLKTLLLEMNSILGGTPTAGGVCSYWFGTRFKDTVEVDSAVLKLADQLGIERKSGIWGEDESYHPNLREYVLAKMCLNAGVDVRLESLFMESIYSELINPKVLSGITYFWKGEVRQVTAHWILDATGDGDVAVSAGADYTYGNDDNFATYWSSLAQYTSPVHYKNNFSSSALIDDAQSYTDFITISRQRGGKIFDYGTYVAPRETRHIRGIAKVDLKDLVTFRTWEHPVYTCFSNYDPKGLVTADMVYLGVLPPQNKVLIPLEACLPVDSQGNRIHQLIVLGKAISATHNAFPAIRMQPDLMHQGAVFGILVSLAIQNHKDILDLNDNDRRDIIFEKTGDPLCLPIQDNALTLDDILSENNNRTHWIDIPFDAEVVTMSNPLKIMATPAHSVVPLLKKAFTQGANQELKMQYAMYLLWHKDDSQSNYLIDSMLDTLAIISELPKRVAPTTCAQLLPDHGVMPEFVYALNSLAWSLNPRVPEVFSVLLDKLCNHFLDFYDIQSGIYHYIESFVYVAERNGDTVFCPLLEKLLKIPQLRESLNCVQRTDIMSQRLQILVLKIYKALTILGSPSGISGLNMLKSSYDKIIGESAKQYMKNFSDGTLNIIKDKVW